MAGTVPFTKEAESTFVAPPGHLRGLTNDKPIDSICHQMDRSPKKQRIRLNLEKTRKAWLEGHLQREETLARKRRQPWNLVDKGVHPQRSQAGGESRR